MLLWGFFWVLWDCFQSSWMLHCSSVYGGIIPLWQAFCEPVEQIKTLLRPSREAIKINLRKKKKKKSKKWAPLPPPLSFSLSFCFLYLWTLPSVTWHTHWPSATKHHFQDQDNSSPYEELLNAQGGTAVRLQSAIVGQHNTEAHPSFDCIVALAL